MMARSTGVETAKVMNAEDLPCSEIRQKTRCIGNNGVMDGRTTRRKSYGSTKCSRLEYSGCHISLRWTVLAVMVFMCYPSSGFGMQVPGSLRAGQRGQGRENGGRQKRAIIGDNVVSIHYIAFDS
jgi:hypothetical protein